MICISLIALAASIKMIVQISPTSLPMHAVEFDRYVSDDKDDGMPSTTPAANTVVVAVPSLV